MITFIILIDSTKIKLYYKYYIINYIINIKLYLVILHV